MEAVRPGWACACMYSLVSRHPLYVSKPSSRHFASLRSSPPPPSCGPAEGGNAPCTAQHEDSRVSILRQLDLALAAGNESHALSLASSAQFRGFGNAAQVPQRLYSIADLRLNDIEASRFLSPIDSSLGEVRRNLQLSAALVSIALWQILQPSQIQVLSALVTFLVISGIDLVAYNGGVEALLLDTVGRIVSEKYKNRVAQPESCSIDGKKGHFEAFTNNWRGRSIINHCYSQEGHFLIAYLLGVLPKSYTLSSLDAYRREGSLNVQAGTIFVDTDFQEEVKSGKLSAGSLNKYSCIALAGVATEYLLFGLAEGGLADIQQLDRLLKSLNFTQMKADSQVRWAVLNIVTILRRHRNIISKLASAMLSGKSVGECIDVIETELLSAKEI